VNTGYLPLWTGSLCRLSRLALLAMLTSAPLGIAAEAAPESVDDPKAVSFHEEVQPIFRRHCVACHQAAKQRGDYRMTDFASLLAGGESGEPAIVPGKPEASYLLAQITPQDGVAAMPPPTASASSSSPALTEIEVALISRWIAEGAIDDSPAESGPRYDANHPPTYIGPPALPSLDVSHDPSSGVTRLAVAGFHEVVVIDLASGQVISRLVGMSPRLNSVRFSPDGKFLAAVGGTPAVSGEVQVWEVDAAELLLSQAVSFDTLSGVSWSPDQTKIAFGAADSVIRAIDSRTGAQVLFQGAHDDWVRDTIFTPDGSHLISVARDMSCKLTEVETERFVDNITSITPGALSGGLNSLARHPERNEIFVGGADGIAKVYRVFRETARKIGDDANLIRNFPAMPGRIFSVAVSPDGSRLAAASTLDGNSQVRVWLYDFDGTLTDEIKNIELKRERDRTPADKAKLLAYHGGDAKQVTGYELAGASIYAIRFAPDNSLVFTADDGLIRHLDPRGELQAEFPAVPVDRSAAATAVAFDAKAWHQTHTEQTGNRSRELGSNGSSIDSQSWSGDLSVSPASIELNSPYDYVQLVVTANDAQGEMVDVTRICQIETPRWTTLTDRGVLRATRDGSAMVTVRFGDQTVQVELVARQITPPKASPSDTQHGEVDFIRDVNPVLSRLGCNQGTCHGAQAGRNGFKLSLRGYDPIFDIRALTDDLSARRINAAAPEESLMLRKPLGLTPHEGGSLMTAGDPYHTILRRWITDGCQLNLETPKVSEIQIFPINPIVESIDATQQVRVVAVYRDGSQRDVTLESFVESGNTDVATTDAQGLLTAVRRGEAPILARYEGAYAATTLTVMGERDGYEAQPYESWERIDDWVAQKWQRMKVVPSELCDDATFFRRVHLDLTGLPPTSDQVRAFIHDQRPTRLKRSEKIDQLIGSDAYVEFWTNKWADLLQVNRKFLGVEGSVKFRDWIRQAIAENRPYDQFAREILTASGSNKDNPAASYFKVLRNPEDTMENTTHLFMGVRFNCNKCHDHPFERWTQDQYYEMSAFFAQVALETDPASGNQKIGGTAVEDAKPLYEKVVDRSDGDTLHGRTGDVVVPSFPVDVPFECSDEATRREQLAAWMTHPENPFFARSYANRLWGYLTGVGLIEPIDDIRAGNPPTNPELLDHLTKLLVDSGFDVQHLMRAICNSRTYQLSVVTNPLNADDALNYARALPRRLPAEVIYDAVHSLTGSISEIPGMPKGTRAAAVTDSGVKLADGFLQNLGRPSRESACECERSTGLQLGPVMALISGPTIGAAIADPKNELQRIVLEHPGDRSLAEEIFLRAVGRYPSPAEVEAFESMTVQIKRDHKQLVNRLEKAEAQWKVQREKLDELREEKLAEVTEKIAARKIEIIPQQAQLAAEREAEIVKAEQALAAAKKQLGTKVANWEKRHRSDTVEWFPLAAVQATSTNQAKLIPQADRSIVASGSAAPSIYTIQAKTNLPKITGIRLETLADPDLPGNGPGLPPNGNFVISELEVKARSLAQSADGKAADDRPLAIASGKADFTQKGFNIEQVFDGVPRGQGGWAVSGATGHDHWATFQLTKPFEPDGETLLTFQIHQFHSATDHRLGRFRISVTSSDADIPLGQSESFAAVLATPPAARTDQQTKLLSDYVEATDAGIAKAKEALATARQPVPPDDLLVQLEKRQANLSKPTADSSSILQLRADAKASTEQIQNIRLTAAEDLTWALINSPAFLFNH